MNQTKPFPSPVPGSMSDDLFGCSCRVYSTLPDLGGLRCLEGTGKGDWGALERLGGKF